MKPRHGAILIVLLILGTTASGSAQSPSEGAFAVIGPRPVHQFTHTLPLTLENVLSPAGPEFHNPGAWADGVLVSADHSPFRADPGLRLGTLLWNQLATGDYWGVDEYQKWPFIDVVRQMYDAVGYGDPCYLPGAGCDSTEECSIWDLESSWEEYQRSCSKDRASFVAYGIRLILWHALSCGCMDSPEGIAAFERVVTQGLAMDDVAVFAAKATDPLLWVPTLRRTAQSYGAMVADEAWGDAPLIFPSLATQVVTIMRRYTIGGAMDSAEPVHGRGQQPPPTDAPAQVGAGNCRPYVWSEDRPMAPSNPKVRYANLRSFYFHYHNCASYIPHQYVLATEVIHPTVAQAHHGFPVMSLLTSVGSQLPGMSIVCPDAHAWGCKYRTQLTSVYVSDSGGHLSLTGQAQRTLAAVRDPSRTYAPQADFVSASEQDVATYLSRGLAGACATAMRVYGTSTPIHRAMYVACGGVLSIVGLDQASRVAMGANGEEASGIKVTDAPPVGTYEDEVVVRIHPDRTHCVVLKEPTWWSQAEWNCPVPVHRRIDISLEYPDHAEVAHPVLVYQAVQAYPIVMRVIG
jgi:hypothetical protein